MDENPRVGDPHDSLVLAIAAAIAAGTTRDATLLELARRNLTSMLAALDIAWKPAADGGQPPAP